MDFKKEHLKALVLAGITGAIATACSGCAAGPFIYDGGYGVPSSVGFHETWAPRSVSFEETWAPRAVPLNATWAPRASGYGR